jgi:hypothetical protein
VRHRKLAWFCLFASIVAACLALWGRDDIEPRTIRLPSPIACSVSFQGYSNSLSGQKWAVLVVTNRDFGDLAFVGPYSVELSSHPSDGRDVHWQLAPRLAPRCSARIAVEIPPEPGTWRARFCLERWTWRDSARNILHRCPDCLRPRRTYKVQYFATDWVPQ